MACIPNRAGYLDGRKFNYQSASKLCDSAPVLITCYENWT